jgi:hypothetical protein
MSERSVCSQCGVTSVAYTEKRLGQGVIVQRDHMPVTFVIRLRPGTTTTYVVTPEVEHLDVHIRSLNDGKLDYAIDVPLWQYREALRAFEADVRVESLYTEHSAPVCASHQHFHETTQPQARYA